LALRREANTDGLENPGSSLQRYRRFTFVRFARSVQVAEYDGVVGEIGSLLKQRDKSQS
jgi:hypothetical protein